MIVEKLEKYVAVSEVKIKAPSVYILFITYCNMNKRDITSESVQKKNTNQKRAVAKLQRSGALSVFTTLRGSGPGAVALTLKTKDHLLVPSSNNNSRRHFP